MPRRSPPRLLTVAGSDSGGGAGIQADLKTFAAHGAYGMSVIAAVTAQNTREVRAVLPLPPQLVVDQLDAVWEDLGVDAVKIGMLATPEIVLAVAAALRRHLAATPVPVVLDPVMVAKSGDALLRDEAIAALTEELLPLATLVTPNLPELARLSGEPLDPAGGDEPRVAAARRLAVRGPAVLAKGGHAAGEEVVDLLVSAPGEGEEVHRFVHPRIRTTSTHGTGCTLSSAIAARLGGGDPLPLAVAGGIEYLIGALRAAYPLGGGHGPVDHLYRLFPSEGPAA